MATPSSWAPPLLRRAQWRGAGRKAEHRSGASAVDDATDRERDAARAMCDRVRAAKASTHEALRVKLRALEQRRRELRKLPREACAFENPCHQQPPCVQQPVRCSFHSWRGRRLGLSAVPSFAEASWSARSLSTGVAGGPVALFDRVINIELIHNEHAPL